VLQSTTYTRADPFNIVHLIVYVDDGAYYSGIEAQIANQVQRTNDALTRAGAQFTVELLATQTVRSCCA
jgi:hypothetical protein